MCPGTFHADGYGFDVTFDIGVVRRKVGKRITSVFDITFIALGERADGDQVKNMVKPPDLSLISRSGLLRLALKAGAIVGVAYPPGWTTDLRGKYITTLKDGDTQPGNSVLYGLQSVTRSRRGVIVDRIVTLESSPDVKVKSAGGDIDEQYMRDLIGQVHVGRHKERGSMTDRQVLKLVAKYYSDGERGLRREAGEKLPAYVQRRLLERDIVQSESWVRQVGVNARKAGYLTTGKRNKSTTKDKR